MSNLLAKPAKLPESLVIKIWQDLLRDKTELTTEEDGPVKVIYPGRINYDNRGADFSDAVIATSSGLIKGDIEIHVKSSDWRAHRHHQDPVYNRVILHVALRHDTKTLTRLQNGATVPTLELDKFHESPLSRRPKLRYHLATLNMSCLKAAGCLTPGAVTGFLDRAGAERFWGKAVKFQDELAQMEVNQCLYRGIMGALGYDKNKVPFLELARRLPLRTLEFVDRGKISVTEYLAWQQALLLGTAGLLPSQCSNWHQANKLDDQWVNKLESLWATADQPQVMSQDYWQLFKVRPHNSPLRRIVAMSYLLLRYRGKGILAALTNRVKEAPTNQGYHQLEAGLMVTATGYWASHFDFGSGSQLRTLALLGSGRAADIIVNVLLPFTLAWSRLTSQPELERKAVDLYHRCPRLTANTVERHMMNQLQLDSSLINSAQRQQGLIHIYKTLCTQGKCHHCPLGT